MPADGAEALARQRCDRVVAVAADEDVAADAGGDGVVAADSPVGTTDGDQRVGERVVARSAGRAGTPMTLFTPMVGEHQDPAVVAEDDVVALAAVDRVAAAAADEDVVVVARIDRVHAAVGVGDARRSHRS